MENTVNYNLKKPGQDDFYNVADFNSNADIIDGALKTHDTQLAQIELELNNKCDKVIPAETVITSGFASGWSGEIRLRKNQEGLVNVYVNLLKSTDVVAGETIANIPIGLRPAINSLKATILCDSIGSPLNNSACFVLIQATGDLSLLTPSGMSTTNARNINSFRTDYY